MKAIKYLFYLILILSNKELLLGESYSIDVFIEYLQETGYYYLIQAVKLSFGIDVATNVCEELTKSNNCLVVTSTYMTNTSENGGGKQGDDKCHIDTEISKQIFEYFENKYNLNDKLRNLIETILCYYSVLKENMDQQQIILLIEKSIIII